MIDWSSLDDVGGSAEHIPELLEELEATRDPEILDELWDRLYHQGSVFSASFAALPGLIRIAQQWHPTERLKILALAVEILSGEDICNLRRPCPPCETPAQWTTTSDLIDLDSPHRDRYQAEIDALLCLTKESFQAPGLWWDGDFISLVIGILTLRGYSGWREPLEYFVHSMSGYAGKCESCDAIIEVYITEDTVIAEVNTDDKQTVIRPASPDSLTGIAKWVYEAALARKVFDPVADKVTYMLGTGVCPKCNTEFEVPELLGFEAIIEDRTHDSSFHI